VGDSLAAGAVHSNAAVHAAEDCTAWCPDTLCPTVGDSVAADAVYSHATVHTAEDCTAWCPDAIRPIVGGPVAAGAVAAGVALDSQIVLSAGLIGCIKKA
jgi:hypothetical protein